MRKKVLIVDDDPNILELLRLYLVKEDFEVISAMTGETALDSFKREAADAILLDLMLPGKSGLDVLRDLRRESSVPVLILTARGDTLDKVVGLELGADDYIEKPFEPQEVIARVKAVIRRASGELEPHKLSNTKDSDQILELGSLVIDKLAFRVMINQSEVDLAPKELELLTFLAENPGRVFTREQLLDSIWGLDYYGDSRTVDVHVRRIREKLDGHSHPDWELKTVWGVGYRFDRL